MYVNGNGIAYGDIITAIRAEPLPCPRRAPLRRAPLLQFGGLNISNGGIFATDPAGLTLDSADLPQQQHDGRLRRVERHHPQRRVQKGAGANDNTLSNNLEGGAVLTVNGNFVNLQKAAQRHARSTCAAIGSTVWNGLIQDNSATAHDPVRHPASRTVPRSPSAATTRRPPGFTGGLVLGQGTLIVATPARLGGASNNLILNGGTLTSTVDLTGANKIVNRVQLAGDQVTISGQSEHRVRRHAVALENNGGNRFLLNESRRRQDADHFRRRSTSRTTNTGRTLTIRGTGVTAITGVVANGGTGASGLAFSGLGSLELTNNATATGALTVNRNLVILSGANGSWNTGTFALNPTGILRLDNSGRNNVLGRLSNTGTFAGNGGTLDIIGNAAGSTHTAGALTPQQRPDLHHRCRAATSI